MEADSALVTELMPSPNHGERVGVSQADTIVLHYTGVRAEAADAWCADPAGEALAWLCNPQAQVSSHYLVREDGSIVQLVPEAKRAWHAGRAQWAGASDMNSQSIGIEIANAGHDGGLPAYTDRQIASVIALVRDICARLSIAPQRVLGHSDIAPGRKLDPGEHFPWDVLARDGIGHWVAPAPVTGGRFLSPGEEGQPIQALQAMLAIYGYGLAISGVYDQATTDVVSAFQRHFRQERVDGIADASTITTLRDLIRALPAAV